MTLRCGQLLARFATQAESVSLFMRVIVVGEKTLGPGHPLTRRYQSHYARLLLDAGRPAEASLSARPHWRHIRPPGNPQPSGWRMTHPTEEMSAMGVSQLTRSSREPAGTRPPQLAPSPLIVSQRAIEVTAMGRSSIMRTDSS
jgi:hypothetical protein